jgi:hypothetical protein
MRFISDELLVGAFDTDNDAEEVEANRDLVPVSSVARNCFIVKKWSSLLSDCGVWDGGLFRFARYIEPFRERERRACEVLVSSSVPLRGPKMCL